MNILEKSRNVWERVYAVSYAQSLLEWDSETYMPEGAAKERGEVSAVLASIIQEEVLSQKVRSLLKEAEGGDDLYARGIARVLRRKLHYYDSLPPELIREMERVTNEAKVVWRNAKKKGDFKMFAPYLEKIVELSREKAEKLGYEGSPYNALLDLYEEGLTVDDVERMFSDLVPFLKRKVRELSGNWPSEHPLEEKEYDKEKMERLNHLVLDLLGFDRNYMRLDVSAHPFTVEMGLYDVRITTWYHGKDFRRSLMATVHEFGHALYERQVDPELRGTPVAGGVSLGIHESQSRFWENIIGRSRAFSDILAPLVREVLGIEVDGEELFRYLNIVRPSLIRVEADEVTYNLHIYLRFNIERSLIEGDLEVGEVPSVWNELMEELLGITPPDDSKGALQDIHWSIGSIGYFPTYSIGTLLAAQIKELIERDMGSLEDVIREKDFSRVREWLREKIHRWGSLYSPKELLSESLGITFSSEPFMRYIEEKYRW